MKLADINAIGGILSGLKINKIADKGAKDTVNRSFLAVRKAMRPFEKDRDEIVAKFREDWKDEITAILENKGGDRSKYEAAQADLKDTLVKMLDEREAEVTFSPVKADCLYEPDLWGENATLGEIENAVNYLVLHGAATL